MRPTETFEAHRDHLHAVAHRVLGSWPDAEDAVQETWLRLQRADVGGVDNLPGWLTTVVSRICLDRLRARRARPEALTGEPPAAAAPDDPAQEAVVADAVGRAAVVVLDALTPAERVAFVLHDVFALPFDEIAPILGRSTEATRKLAQRARQRARARRDTGDPDGRRRLVQAFLDAVRAGDVDALLAVLAPDAVRRVDPVLLPPGAPAVVRGAAAIAEETRRFSAPARVAQPVEIDGAPGAVVVRGGRRTLALTFTVGDGRIAAFEVIADPARLAGLSVTDPSPDRPSTRSCPR